MAVTTYDWSEANYGTKLNLTGYKLDFVDDFNTDTIVDGTRYDTGTAPWQTFDLATAPSGTKWFSPVHNNYGGATFGKPDTANDPFKVANGELTITMKKDASGRWTSGSMNSTDFWDQGYEINQGYFEIRAKFDRADAPGAWPAFWLISQEGTEKDGWGTRIEYDILEAYGTDPDGHHTAVHVDDPTNQSSHTSNYAGLTANGMGANMFDGQYHTYGGLIEDDQIITYMDGIEIARQKITSDWDAAKFHMIVSLAMNPDEVSRASGEYHMTVDYVKTYVKGGDGSNPLSQPAPTPTPTPDLTPEPTTGATEGADFIAGTSSADTFRALAGNDTVHGEDGDDQIWGGLGDDALSGEFGVDTLYGEAGNDRFDGGDGSDHLYGGAGRDTFVFDNRLGSSNVDSIYDFSVADDTIALDDLYYNTFGSRLDAGEFRIGTRAADRSDKVIYDQASGALYYDPDGSGSGAQIKIAQLSAQLKMTAADFVVM
jgi:Ca2+-binding RTX toxin-like protein